MRYSIIAEDTNRAEIKRFLRECKELNVRPLDVLKNAPLWLWIGTPEQHFKMMDALYRNRENERLNLIRKQNELAKDFDRFRKQVRKED